MSADPDGPVKLTLDLKSDDGEIREFDLGNYSTMAFCADELSYEIQDAEENRNSEFWTNQEFDYGGYPQDGWERNIIVSAKCTKKPAPEA